MREGLEDIIKSPSTKESAVAKHKAAQMLAVIPDERKLLEWSRGLVCEENSVDGSAAGKEGSE